MGIPVDQPPEPGAACPYDRALAPIGCLADGELGWLDPPMNIEKSQRVWSYSWARPVPANAAEPNVQVLYLGAIRAIDPWGKSGLVLKLRRWKVAYPELHNQVLPDPTDLYSPKNWRGGGCRIGPKSKSLTRKRENYGMTQRSQRKTSTLHGVCGY